MAITASIIGASGYGGGELARLLLGHPKVEVVHLTADRAQGEPIAGLYPNLRGLTASVTEPLSAGEVAADSDVVFVALPNGKAMTLVPALVERTRVVDLGADFRFKDPHVYERWYGTPHACPDLLDQAAYGLTEFHRGLIRTSRIVGNPGCYPTAALLAIAPLLRSRAVSPSGVIIDAKSGVSGAGRGLSLGTHFSEVNENVIPYNVAGHRHTPEVEQELAGVLGRDAVVSFTPHLIPMTRGILATAYLRLTGPLTTAEATAIVSEAYAGEPFVRVLDEALPQTKATSGSNFCDIAVRVDSRAGVVIAMAALDNLVKGASGQAVQNMNVMFGLPEETGLRAPGVYP